MWLFSLKNSAKGAFLSANLSDGKGIGRMEQNFGALSISVNDL